MIEIAPGWALDAERGPDWLYVRVIGPVAFTSDEIPLAEHVWALMEQHFVNRVVLEFDDTPVLYSRLIGELVLLQKRITTNGGLIRLCGLNQAGQASLRACRLETQLPSFADRGAAVMGHRPPQPR